MIHFRIHFENAQPMDLVAASADEARKHASKLAPGKIISKVKIVKEK